MKKLTIAVAAVALAAPIPAGVITGIEAGHNTSVQDQYGVTHRVETEAKDGLEGGAIGSLVEVAEVAGMVGLWGRSRRKLGYSQGYAQAKKDFGIAE